MSRKEAQIAHLNQPSSGHEEVARIARTGRIAAVSDEGTVMIVLSGEKRPMRARLAVAATLEQIERAIQTRQEVLLLLENGATDRPIIVGFIDDAAKRAVPAPEARAKTGGPETSQVIEADVDGKRVRVVAKDEIVLECGSASITLRRNGRVIIKGTYVETHSDGTNRIKGGQVRIN